MEEPEANEILDFWEAYDRIDPLSLGTWDQTAKVCHQVENVIRTKVPKYKGLKETDFLPLHAVRRRDKPEVKIEQSPEEIEATKKAAEKFAASQGRRHGIH